MLLFVSCFELHHPCHYIITTNMSLCGLNFDVHTYARVGLAKKKERKKKSISRDVCILFIIEIFLRID